MGVCGLTLLILYNLPVPQTKFDELYKKVSLQKRQSLLDFREKYPPKILRVDGHEWVYLSAGHSEKTILFLHGMTGAYDIWWQQMTALSKHYRVISVTYPAVDNLAGMSRGVLAVLDALKIDKAFLVGSSLGGYFVQYLMANYPARFEKAVLGNTFAPNDVLRARNEKIIKLLPFLPEWLVMRKFRTNFKEVIYPTSRHSELVLSYMLEQVAGRMNKAQVTARAKAVIEPFKPAGIQENTIPVMIVESDNDPLVEKTLREQLLSTYPWAQKDTFQDAGHFPYLNEPDKYTRLLESFFNSN